jgi:hypothetical protein
MSRMTGSNQTSLPRYLNFSDTPRGFRRSPVEDGAMRFVEDDQVEESRQKLFVANAHGLLGRHIKPLIGVYVRRADAHAGLIWEMVLKPSLRACSPDRGGAV